MVKHEGDKFTIGSYMKGDSKKYTNHRTQLKKEDMIYAFTDGYHDQYGGDKNTKFTAEQFQKTLMSIGDSKLSQQKLILDKMMEEWKGDNEQVDDMLVIGVKV